MLNGKKKVKGHWWRKNFSSLVFPEGDNRKWPEHSFLLVSSSFVNLKCLHLSSAKLCKGMGFQFLFWGGGTGTQTDCMTSSPTHRRQLGSAFTLFLFKTCVGWLQPMRVETMTPSSKQPCREVVRNRYELNLSFSMAFFLWEARSIFLLYTEGTQ